MIFPNVFFRTKDAMQRDEGQVSNVGKKKPFACANVSFVALYSIERVYAQRAPEVCDLI